MDKTEFVQYIEKEISKGELILERFKSLNVLKSDFGDGMAFLGSSTKPQVNSEMRESLIRDLTLWERRVYEILKSYFGNESDSHLNEFNISDTNRWFGFKETGIQCMNRNLTTLRSYIERIDFLKAASVEYKQDNAIDPIDKPFKVFISHSSEDIAFVKELVRLLEFLGVDTKEKLLCSSVKGYQIPTSEDFAHYILNQFNDYRLFVIIVHSFNYYKSSYCLNEMGAAWVLKTDFFSFLVKGFDYSYMDGVINQSSISAKVDKEEAKGRLDELKDKLIPLFKPQGVNNSRWEDLRDDFLKNVNEISIAENQMPQDLFNICYLPLLEKIFSLIDMQNYSQWTYNWAFSGTSKISIVTYSNLEKIRDLVKRMCYHDGYEPYNSLLKNLDILLTDYLDLCEQHLISLRNDTYSIERFYKKIPNNPEYETLLKEYQEYSLLLCDVTLELTRILNLLLEKIREKVPDFHVEDGILLIKSIERENVMYQKNEKTNSPYPGLKEFLKIRSTRTLCYSRTDKLDFVSGE